MTMRGLFLPFIAMALLARTFSGLRSGKIEWYGGEPFVGSRSEGSAAFWMLIVWQLSVVVLILWAIFT